jgi:nucleotide-sensitive chloride channel 1A
MTLTVLNNPPTSSEFVPLSEHQSQTPSSFFSQTPVLHYHGKDLKVVVPSNQLSALPIFSKPKAEPEIKTSTGGQPNGTHDDSTEEQKDDEKTTITGIETWVTSKWVKLLRRRSKKLISNV